MAPMIKIFHERGTTIDQAINAVEQSANRWLVDDAQRGVTVQSTQLQIERDTCVLVLTVDVPEGNVRPGPAAVGGRQAGFRTR